MKISHRHKFIFFSNPKTGSQSVRELLRPISDICGISYPKTTEEFPFYSHMRPIELVEAFEKRGWKFSEYYKFTCVRNPWARAVSLYEMIRRDCPSFRVTFGEWLNQCSSYGIGGGGRDSERWRKYGTYSIWNYAGDTSGNLLVNDVFRTEDLGALPDELYARGIPISSMDRMPRINRGKKVPYQEYYDANLRDLVYRRYEREILEFGYTFDGAIQLARAAA